MLPMNMADMITVLDTLGYKLGRENLGNFNNKTAELPVHNTAQTVNHYLLRVVVNC